MSQPAVIQADYVDLRFVKGRKVAQIVVEIPIEAAGAFVDAFGTPMPDKNVPIALARLNTADVVEKPKGGKLAQQAGILCGEVAFLHFIQDNYQVSDPEDFVRRRCGVKSRAELDHNSEAARIFHDLRASYNVWAMQ